MTSRYIENASSGTQYYFNPNDATTSQLFRTHQSYVLSPYVSSNYSAYSRDISSPRSLNQPIRLDDSYQTPQQYHSVAGFNRGVTHPHYQTPQSLPHGQTTVRAINNQDQNYLRRSPQPKQVSPQHHHFQFDTRQQPGHPTGPPVIYQTPGAAQFTHRNVDIWTENPSRNYDHHSQARRISVRSVSSDSPQRHQDHLQQYYSQLTPEQHQQLLRQQQIQRQQEQAVHHEQQHRAAAPQYTSPSSNYQQEQYRSTAKFNGGQHYQQVRSRSASERQHQDERDYYAAQRQMVAQRAQQQQEQSSHPVGIRNLMSKFAGSASRPIYQPPRSIKAQHFPSSTYASNTSQHLRATTRTVTTPTMTYSALPKPHEPPVNSAEYYQMQMQRQGGTPFTNIQHAAAPPHIQHSPTGFGTLRDRFKKGSLPDEYGPTHVIHRQEQQPTSTAGGNSLSSLRNQYMTQTKQSTHNKPQTQQIYHIPRTIVGEDLPGEKQQQRLSQQQQSELEISDKKTQQEEEEEVASKTPSQQEQPTAVTAEAPEQQLTPTTQTDEQSATSTS